MARPLIPYDLGAPARPLFRSYYSGLVFPNRMALAKDFLEVPIVQLWEANLYLVAASLGQGMIHVVHAHSYRRVPYQSKLRAALRKVCRCLGR